MEEQHLYQSVSQSDYSSFNEDIHRYEHSESRIDSLSCCLSMVFPCVWMCSCYTLDENVEGIVLNWGKFVRKETQSGCHFSNPCGRSVIRISTKQISHNLKDVKVVDCRGNPLLICGVVRYFWENTTKTALECENSQMYVERLATTVLKQVVSKYPYESTDGGPCLKSESKVVQNELRDVLQARVSASGARIVGLNLTEIAYAPEISQAMLKRQQAHAIVEARQAIVQGAVDIATEAVDELSEKGHK